MPAPKKVRMDPEENRVADLLFDLSLGSQSPLHSILTTGAFPRGWVDDYLENLGRATAVLHARSHWPKKLVAAVHVAALYYLPTWYEGWQRFNPGAKNLETETAIKQIRLASEVFLLGPAMDKLHPGSIMPGGN
jgi:hypothetical protein